MYTQMYTHMCAYIKIKHKYSMKYNTYICIQTKYRLYRIDVIHRLLRIYRICVYIYIHKIDRI